jgi:WD40 repeat protein
MLEEDGNLLRQSANQVGWRRENRGPFPVTSLLQSSSDGGIYWLADDGRVWSVKPTGGPAFHPFPGESFRAMAQCLHGRLHLLRIDGKLLRADLGGVYEVKNLPAIVSLKQGVDGALYALQRDGVVLSSRAGNDDRWEAAHPRSIQDVWQINPGTAAVPRLLESAGGTDAFLAKLSPGGDPIWMRTLGGTGMDSGHDVAVDSSGSVYVGGVFDGTAGMIAAPGLASVKGSASREGMVAKFSAEGEVLWIRPLGGPGSSRILGVAVDASGRVYGTGAFEGTIQIESGRSPVSFTCTGNTADLFVSRIVPAHSPAATLDLPEIRVPEAAFTPDGRKLALACTDRQVRLWQPTRATDRPHAMSHAPDEAWAVAFSPDGKLLASGGDNSTHSNCLRVWDAASGRLRWSAPAHTALVSCLTFSPDGSLLATGSYDNTIKLWEPGSGRPRGILKGHTGALRCLAFSPDGTLLASGGKDQIAHLWDVSSGSVVHTFTGHGGEVRAVAFSPDGRHLVTGEDEQEVRTWDIESGRLLESFIDSSPVQCLSYYPDGTALTWGLHNGVLKSRDFKSGHVRTFGGRHPGEIRSLAITKDGRRVVTGGTDGTVRLWETRSGRELLALNAGSRPINAVSFSPNGERLAAASHDGSILVWHAPADHR